jgi:DNA-binding transcriptional ArsR family regulator
VESVPSQYGSGLARSASTQTQLTDRDSAGPAGVDDGELVSDFSPAEASQLARSLKALADPIRLRLVSLIGTHPEGQASVFELAQAFHVTGPTLSHHLRVLREAGLVSADRRGTWVYYALVPEGLSAICGVLGSTFPVAGRTPEPAQQGIG